MKIAVTLHTTDYRGDHSSDAEIAWDIDSTTTVEALVKKLLPLRKDHKGKVDRRTFVDFIQIRRMMEHEHGNVEL